MILIDFLGTTLDVLYRIEKGDCIDFDKSYFNKLYIKLKCHPAYLVGVDDNPNPPSEPLYNSDTFGYVLSGKDIVDANPAVFGKRLSKLRKENGFKQKELADLLKLTPQHISKIEKGRFKNT